MPSLATRVIPFLQVRESDRIDLSGLVCSVLKLNYVEDVNMSTIRCPIFNTDRYNYYHVARYSDYYIVKIS